MSTVEILVRTEMQFWEIMSCPHTLTPEPEIYRMPVWRIPCVWFVIFHRSGAHWLVRTISCSQPRHRTFGSDKVAQRYNVLPAPSIAWPVIIVLLSGYQPHWTRARQTMVLGSDFLYYRSTLYWVTQLQQLNDAMNNSSHQAC